LILAEPARARNNGVSIVLDRAHAKGVVDQTALLPAGLSKEWATVRLPIEPRLLSIIVDRMPKDLG
jgi:hypothetical protein